MDKAFLGRKEDEEMGYEEPLMPRYVPQANPQLSGTVTVDSRISISTWKWVDLELRQVPKWMKKEI